MGTPRPVVVGPFIARAIALGADAVEIEPAHAEESVTAFKGSLGVGIGSLRGAEADALREELWQLRGRKPRLEIDTVQYTLSIRTFDSFGETAFRVEISKATSAEDRNRDGRAN